MAKHRTYSIEFKRQVAQEFLAGESLHGLSRRHDVSRNLIRVGPSQKWRAPTETGGVPWDEESGLRRSSSARRCAWPKQWPPRAEIAEDLGVGLSSLTRWIGQFRDEEMPPEIKDDLQAELKRLRKENAVLRQERDILKKAAAFFAKEGSR